MKKATLLIRKILPVLLLLLICVSQVNSQTRTEDSLFIVQNYEKQEYQIPMRDGTKLFTSVYIPKDKKEKYPIMLLRTPYSVSPYGKDKFKTLLGPSKNFTNEKMIFVYQDVRGKYMSDGEFVNVRPQIPLDKKDKKNKKQIDESTDTYEAIEWLIKNIDNNNGKVGMWGISYPGFYSTLGALSGHPALVAVSPQAPIADWYWDDFFHHGAFFLPHAFNFMSDFGKPRPYPTTGAKNRRPFNHGTPDGYKFFLDELGLLKNVNPKFFKDSIAFWKELASHPNYDTFWQSRSVLPHLKNIKPAVMTVGGWFDAEDLYGPLKTYETIEKNNPKTYNMLVMGPWRHGGWARGKGDKLGNVHFDAPTAIFYQDSIEFPFFMYHLKNEGNLKLPEAFVFETGKNEWEKFNQWPPANTQKTNLYFSPEGKLSFTLSKMPLFFRPSGNPIFDSLKTVNDFYSEFISDPSKPVPFTEATTTQMTTEYMTDDQRFAGRRPDVLVFQTDTLTEDITFAGNIFANLKVSTTGSDADWIVKVIDVYPDNHKDYADNPKNIKMGGYEQLVRGEVFRGRFRNSYEKPEPFVPNQVTDVKFELQDVLHTFKKGHRIMIQVQSTWFPLVDRNPQKYVPNIFEADEKDFIKATHRVYHSKENPSFIEFRILK